MIKDLIHKLFPKKIIYEFKGVGSLPKKGENVSINLNSIDGYLVITRRGKSTRIVGERIK